MIDKYFLEYKDTGEMPVNIENVIKDWSILFAIYAYFNNDNQMTYRLVKRESLETDNTDFKCSISAKDAEHLIDNLNLISKQSPVFKRSYTFRKSYHQIVLDWDRN